VVGAIFIFIVGMGYLDFVPPPRRRRDGEGYLGSGPTCSTSRSRSTHEKLPNPLLAIRRWCWSSS
jgi:hypothetical protein